MINMTSSRALLLIVGTLFLAGCGGGGESTEPASYEVDIYNGWPQDVSKQKVGRYVESQWHDPVSTRITIAIDSAASDETGSPSANAELAQIQTTKLPGYRERGRKWIRLGGRPAIRWAFDIGGQAHIEYFFEECGTSFVVRGATPPVAFAALSESFRTMAATIKVACDE